MDKKLPLNEKESSRVPIWDAKVTTQIGKCREPIWDTNVANKLENTSPEANSGRQSCKPIEKQKRMGPI